jgi:hypothetical protein
MTIRSARCFCSSDSNMGHRWHLKGNVWVRTDCC